MTEPKWHEKREFLKERKKWYAKLKKEGFTDIENIDWSNGESYECVNGMSSADMVLRYTPEQERYYQLANQFVWWLKKERVRDRYRKKPRFDRDRWKVIMKVWQDHAAGLSIRQCSSKRNLGRNTVHGALKTIRPLFKEWIAREENE